MNDVVRQIGSVRLLVCAEDGALLTQAGDINTFISEAWSHDAAGIVLPVKRLGDDFFSLRTGLAGEVVQKFANYRRLLAVVGDVSRWTAVSKPLRDFIYESNRGQVVWFVKDMDELQRRL